MGTPAITRILTDYYIADLDAGSTSYYGFVNKNGHWYILKLTSTAARYVAGTTGYTASWAGRAGLSYDVFYNVF